MKAVSIVMFAGMVGCASVQPISAADAVTLKETVLHSFSGGGTDGAYPAAGVIDVKGVLYGTTLYGSGDGLRGTVFAVNRKTGAETVVYSFCSRAHCADGFNPSSGLINVKGMLYGTTGAGGGGFAGQQFGTAFALDPNTGKERVLYSFCQQQNCPDGAYPDSLIAAEGVLYGTTDLGGGSFNGTAFALDPHTRTETVLYSFCSQKNCPDGKQPFAAPIDVNGTLYGTTGYGGQGSGTVFSLDPKTAKEKVLHSFGNGTDGRVPFASLIAVNGMLYGTTYAGGVTGCGHFGCGTVFSIDPGTGAETVLYSFCSQQNCTDGASPFASLIAVNGTLYGTTYGGGGSGCGTVFSLDPNTGTETVLYSFGDSANDGVNPDAGLIAVHGKLYGTTYAGGAYGYGTVFVLKQTRQARRGATAERTSS